MFTLITDRWIDALDNATPADKTLVRGIQEWLEAAVVEKTLRLAPENFFIARHTDGRVGALLEMELDDEFIPTPEHVEAARATTVAPGEFRYVEAGGDEIFNGRAAYQVFFPGRFFDCAALEATAAQLHDLLY